MVVNEIMTIDSGLIVSKIKKYTRDLTNTLELLPRDKIAAAIEIIEEACLKNKKIIIFGNGGSAATALHFACDLSKGSIRNEKPRMRVFTLTDNIALLTAWANDNMYRNSFAEQIENLIDTGDVAIAISASGNSWNVLNAAEVARLKGAKVVGFTGFDGGKLKKHLDIEVRVACTNMEQIEDIHLVIAHIIKTCLKEIA